MPVSEKLLSLGKEFGTDLIDTVIDDDDKKKKKGKVSQRLLDVGKRIEFLDKTTQKDIPATDDSEEPGMFDYAINPDFQSPYTPQVTEETEVIEDYGIPEGFIDYDTLGTTKEERIKKAQELLKVEEPKGTKSETPSTPTRNIFEEIVKSRPPYKDAVEGEYKKPEQTIFDLSEQQKRQMAELRSLYDEAGGIETQMDINKAILRGELGKEFNKILQFPALRPIKESLERLADNSNYQLQVDMIRYERLKKQKEEAVKLGADVPYYDQELERLEKKITQPTFRRFSKDLLATAQLGISVIPKMMLLNAVSEPTMKLTGDIATEIGGESVRPITETLTHLGLAATLGLPVLIGSLTSMGADATAQKILEGVELNEEDKALIQEAAGHIGFFAGLTAGVKLKGKIDARFDPKNMDFVPDIMFPRPLQPYSRFEKTLNRPLTKQEQKIVDIYNKRQEDIRKNPSEAYSEQETKLYEEKVRKIKEDAGEEVTDVYKMLFPEEFKTKTPKTPKEEKPIQKSKEELEKELNLPPGPPVSEIKPGRTIEEEAPMLDAIAGKIARGNEASLTNDEKELQGKYPNYIKAIVSKIKESPEFQEEQRLKRQKQKERTKADTDNYVELNRQFKSAQRKRILFDTEILRNEVNSITTPEIRAKADKLLKDAIDYNDNLKKKNEFTLENLSRKKYGTTDLNSLDEQQQKDLLNEYNEMKKQGITEFSQIKSIKPIVKPIKEEDYAIQERSTEEILQRKPEEVRGEGSERGGVEPSEQGEEITEAEEEGFIKRPSEEETRTITEEETGKKFYRGGGEGSMPKGKTAQDIINYENEELGNNVQPEPNIELSSIPSEKLVWLTETEADALQYGEAEEYDVGDNYRIVARDQDGGVLIEQGFTGEIKPGDDLEVDTQPSEAQIEAGNYKKGHIKREGLDITIENLKGSTRSGTAEDGTKWEVEMKNDYGYIKGTVGRDKDHLDVFLAEDYQENSPVFIVNQTTPDGKFDEHKVMLGFENPIEAKQAYVSNYEEGKAHFSDIIPMSMDEFKEWSKNPKLTKKPAGFERKKVKKETFAEKHGDEFLDMIKKLPQERQDKIRADYKEERGKITNKYQSKLSEANEFTQALLGPDAGLTQEQIEQRQQERDEVDKKYYDLVKSELATKEKGERPAGIIDDDMKDIIKDIEKGLEGITFQLKKPSLQLKPGEKIPAEIQTKANDLIGRFIDKEVYEFDNIILAVQQAFGDDTLRKIFPAVKAGYTAYLTNAPDEIADKMDSFDYVKRYTIEKAIKTTKTEEKPTEPIGGETGVSRPYIQRVREEIRKGNVLTKTQLENLAKEFGITDPNIAKEQAELAIVAEARKIISETKDEKEAYDKVVELYKNQPNLTHRTSESVEKQQYSTPAPIALNAGLYVADGIGNGDVLEPSAGNGMLVIAFNTGQVYVNEIDEIRNANLRQSDYEGISNIDAEKNDNLFGKKFDGIITNPPFGSAETKKFNDYKLSALEHILAANALKQMKKDGRAAIIIGGHNRYDNKGRLQSDRIFFNWLYHHHNVDAVLNISGDLYKKQGTQFPIRLILINGKKETPQGAAPLYDEIRDAVIKDFDELYNKVKEIRNETLLRSQADAKQGLSGTSDVRSAGGTKIQKPGRTETIPEKPTDKIDEQKPTKPGTTGGLDTGDTGAGKPLPEQPTGISGLDTGKPKLPGGIQPEGSIGRDPESTGSGKDIQGGFDREPSPTIERADLESGKPNVPYKPQSKGTSLDTVIPRNMSYETFRQLQILAEDLGGDLDQFVVDKLGYKDKEELFSHLGAEQIDATALAIVSIEKGQGMIIGDMAGVGKGRIAASIIRYAVLNGFKPMFFTEKARLFTDLYRDMKDTGNKNLKPFIINDTADANITDAEGKVVYSTIGGEKKRKHLSGLEIGDADYLVGTYSQVQSEKSIAKRRFISAMAENNIIIMDESHNASGQGNTSVFFKAIADNAKGVTFLSATFAKRPNNMPVYAMKTAISEANLSETQLVEAIEKGGVALQEILSTDLVESQQMIRREKSYEGIKIEYKPLETKKAEHTTTVDKATEIIRDIINFQNEHIKPIVDIMDTEASAEGEAVGIEQGTNLAGVDNTPFANKVFNVVDQLLFSLKAQDTALETIEQFKQGKKPVIAIKNTMEAFLDYMDAQEGDVIESTDFSAVLERALKGVFRIRTRDATGKSVPGEISLGALSDAGRKEYRRILDKINEATTGITISPIDHMIYVLNKAGYKVGEVTGRKIRLQFRDDGKAIVVARTERDINKTFREFNNWENPGEPRGPEGYTDMALMINSSGSTGGSAHSSPSFKDQRPRVMVTTQIELNINTEVQKRGRINRTGQVVLPEYITLASAIPAEQRLLMMAKKKLKSLDANVSSDQKQAGETFQVNDFLNKYGDEIVIEYLKENREMNDMLLDPFHMNEMAPDELDKFTRKEKAAHRVTGRVAILPTHLQEEFYKEIGQRYDDYITYLNSIGENDLEVKVMPLDALTTSSRMLVAGKGGTSPFGKDSIIETAEVNVLKKPYRLDKITEITDAYLEGKGKGEKKKELLSDFSTFWKDWTKEHLDKRTETIAKDWGISKETLDAHLHGRLPMNKLIEENPRLAGKETIFASDITKIGDLAVRLRGQGDLISTQIIGHFNIGDVYKIPLVRDNVAPIYSNGIFLGWKINPKRRNPYAPSAIMLRFAVNDSRRIVEILGSKRDWWNDIISNSYSLSQWQKNDIIKEWDETLPDNRREIKHIVTGNILQAYGGNDVKGGQLISYSTKEGGLKRGILITDSKAIADDGARVPIKRARNFIVRIEPGNFIESSNGEVSLINKNDRTWVIEVNASKKRGGKYYLDEGLRKLTSNGRFDKWGNVMRAEFSRSDLDNVINILQDDFGISVRLSPDDIKSMGDENINYQLKGAKAYKDDFGNAVPPEFVRIHEFKLKHPRLKNKKVEIIPPKIVYWTRAHIKSYGYTDDFVNTLPKLNEGDFGYEPGKEKFAVEITGASNIEGSGADITISSTATPSAYAEEIIHTIQKEIENVSPEMARRISDWESDVRELAEAGGIQIPQNAETFAQAFVFTHLGYASENPDVAELYEIPKDIYEDFVAILEEGEITSDVLRGETQRKAIRLPSGNIDNSLQNFRQKRQPTAFQLGTPKDVRIVKGQDLLAQLKAEHGEKADIYPEWRKKMKEEFGKDIDINGRQIWNKVRGFTPNIIEYKGMPPEDQIETTMLTYYRGFVNTLSIQKESKTNYQLKPASKELIGKVEEKGLVIDQNLIATYNLKGQPKEYVSVSTPDKVITKIIEVEKLDAGLKTFPLQQPDRASVLSPKQILTNSSGLYPTPTALKDAQKILGDKFSSEFEKFKDKRKGDPDYPIEDVVAEIGFLLEAFARRVVAAKRLGIKDIEADLYQEALKWDKKNYQLRKPNRAEIGRIFNRLETELDNPDYGLEGLLADAFGADYDRDSNKIIFVNRRQGEGKYTITKQRFIEWLQSDEAVNLSKDQEYQTELKKARDVIDDVLSGETFQLRKPKKDRSEKLLGRKTATELAREQGRTIESEDGNLVDFGVGFGQVFTETADRIADFVKNSRLEKELGIDRDPKLKKLYREFLTSPQWFFDKEPQLKRVWDIIDRHFVRNVNEESAILREDKWENGRNWRDLTDLEQKEFLSALEEYEFTQYELQRDGEDLELLDWADLAGEFNLTPRVTEFLFQAYKPVIETALDMVKDVDRYKIINETQHNPYLQSYYEAVAAKAPQQRLDNELERAKDEFFNDDPNAEALFENELIRMARANQTVSELKALELAWKNNPNLRETLAEVLIDKKYERIDGKAYFPSSRLDRKYFLSAIRKTTPGQKLLGGKFDDKHFTTNDSLDKLNRIKAELEAIGYTVKVGKFAEAQEEILANAITQEDVLDLALSAGIDNDNPILERLIKTIQAKGFSKHFIPKRFIPGFDYSVKPFEEAIFRYMNSVPFYKNRTIGGKELEKTLADLKHRKILKPGSSEDRYIQDLKTKIENRDVKLSQALRAVTSAYYLALSPAYLSQQIVQPLNTLLPYLPITAKELGLRSIEAEKAFAEAIGTSLQYWAWKVYDKANRTLGRTTGNTFGLDRDFLWHMRALERQGVGKPLRSMELTGQEVDPQKHYFSNLFNVPNKTLRWASTLASLPGIAVEDFTRTIGMRAFYILGRKAGLAGDKLQDFISNSIAKTYGPASGRLAKPPGYYIAGEGRMKPMKEIAQSTIESWLTFKNFAFMHYGQWGKIWRSLKNDGLFRTLVYKLGAQIGLAGLKYMMWTSSILTLMSGIYALLNITEDPEEQYEELFLHFNKLVPGLGDALYKGIASLTFKVDLSALFAQTAPIEEPFTKSAEELIGGAPVSAAKDIIAGRLPRALRGFQQSKKYEEEGVTLGSRKLIPPEQISEADKTKRKLGFTPLEISKAYQKENTRQFKSSQYTDEIRKAVKDKIIPLIEQGKGKEARELFKKFYDDMLEDDILTDKQKKSVIGTNSFISQVVLQRLEEKEREIIRDWKNGSKIKSGNRNDRPNSNRSGNRPGGR